MPRRTRTPVTDPKLAVAYVRVSTEDQALGADAQLAAIERWATAGGVQIVSVCSDLGVSGAAELDRRPALLEALTELEARRAGVLVVAKRDRLARDVVIAAAVERLTEGKGACVVSADGAGNGDTPEAMLLRGLVNLFAQYERALIKSRTRAALAVKRAKGVRLGAAPFGWAALEPSGPLIAHDAEQSIVARIGSLRADGASIRQIAAQLNAEGIQARGSRWHPTTVARVLERHSTPA